MPTLLSTDVVLSRLPCLAAASKRKHSVPAASMAPRLTHALSATRPPMTSKTARDSQSHEPFRHGPRKQNHGSRKPSAERYDDRPSKMHDTAPYLSEDFEVRTVSLLLRVHRLPKSKHAHPRLHAIVKSPIYTRLSYHSTSSSVAHVGTLVPLAWLPGCFLFRHHSIDLLPIRVRCRIYTYCSCMAVNCLLNLPSILRPNDSSTGIRTPERLLGF